MIRLYMWLFRHHRCSICRLPRPVWLRGDHTSCLLYTVERLRREEVARAPERFRPQDAERDEWGCMR